MPWPDSAVPLLTRIRTAIAAGRTEPFELEIDDHNPDEVEQIRWIAGAREAVTGGLSDTARQTNARTLAAALGNLIRRPSSSALAHFYELAERADVLGTIDGFLDTVRKVKLDTPSVANFARWMASEAPTLKAVKFSLALLGTVSSEADIDLVLDLGAYEELTLYAVVALSNMLSEPEQAIWTLARRTKGWGRIQTIRRLTNPQDEDVRFWLLTEGHRNAVMVEEIAYFCAVHGGLLKALQADNPSEALLDGAGELLTALINGGPAEDMDDYDDGGEASRLFVEHICRRRSDSLERFLHVKSLQGFVSDPNTSWEGRQQNGWTPECRWAVRTGTATFLGDPHWRDLAEAGLLKESRQEFWSAAAVAAALEIDTWPHYLRRQRQYKSGEWYWLMQTDDPARVQQVVELALAQLDLQKVGSGPTKSLGLGVDYADDSAVDFILQDLRRFPGLGWPIVEVGLRARSIRARNMAHKALAAWGREHWPPPAESALRAALDKEPDQAVAERTLALLEGRPID